MNKPSKLFLTSGFCMVMIAPAMADIAANNNNPTCDATTIGATSGDTALDAVWNIVNQTCNPGQYFDMTTATCVTCTANSYCPGGTYNVESQTNGLNSCPNGYGLSASGAGAQTDCYRNCTTSDVAHSAGVTGGYYYGDNNQCAATSCAAGWHVKPGLNLATEFANAEQTNSQTSTYGHINANGNFNEDTWNGTAKGQSGYGLTQPMEYAVSFDDYSFGMVRGQARCSSTPGTNPWNGGSLNMTTFNSLMDETGEAGANYCYCNITGYKPVNGSLQSLSSAWVFLSTSYNASSCASSCAQDCANFVRNYSNFRGVLFGAVAPSLASCEANTINITWYNGEDVHDENTCTYAEPVTLPETNPERTGYNFTGWTVRPASTPATTE